MSDNNSSAEMNKYLFVNLVTMLSMAVMQQLGKLVNPGAGKAEVNLDAAQATIDTLDMLAEKTKGNLDAEEAKLIKDTLAMLKMNFVETRGEEEIRGQRSAVSDQRSEVREQRSAGSDQKSAKAEDQKKNTDTPEGSQTADDKAETKDPKFHKSYN